MIDGFQIHYNKKIGEGAFASIYECEKQDIKNACVKILKLDNEHWQYFQNEKQILEVLQKIENPNLIKIYNITQQNQNVYIFMEKYKYNLEQWIEKKRKENELFSVLDIMRMIHQIVNGFKTLYNIHIIHRDLKPENILVGDDGQLKISDFGFGKFLGQLEVPLRQTMLGTPFFSSPQCLNDGIYSSKTDIYSLGVIVFYITFQRHLFQVPSFFELINELEKIKNSIVRIPKIMNQGIEEQVSELEDFFQLTITYDEDTRIDWQTLFEWFSEDRNIYQDQLLITQQFKQLRREQKQQLSGLIEFDTEEEEEFKINNKVQNKALKKNQSLMKLIRFVQQKIQLAQNTLLALVKVKKKIINEFTTLKYLILAYQYFLQYNLVLVIEGNKQKIICIENAKFCEKFSDSLINDCLEDNHQLEIQDSKSKISEEVQKLKYKIDNVMHQIRQEKYKKAFQTFDKQKLTILDWYKENFKSILASNEIKIEDVDFIKFMAYSCKFCQTDINFPISNFKQIDLESISTLTEDVNQLIKFIELNNLYKFK